MNPNDAPNTPPQNTMPSRDDMELDTPPASPPQFAKKSVQRKKRLVVVVGIVLAVLIVAGAAYWFFMMRENPRAKTATTPTPQPAASSTEDPVVEDATIATYKSSAVNIEFSHRKDWKVREYADKSEVVVTSPKVSYTKSDGTATEGVFTLRLRSGTIPEAIQSTVIKAIAVRDSEIIAYDAPAAEQRQYTNITDAGSDANTFNFVVVSSSTGFKAGQPLGYGVNLTGDAYLFAGGYGKDEGNTLTFDGIAKADFVTPTYEQAIAIIKSLKVF